MANNYDSYLKVGTSDAGSAAGAGGAAASTGLVAGTVYNVRVPLTAGAGTALDISVPIGVKSRLIDATVLTTTTVTSAVVQVFTAASGGGTACTSSMAAAAAGRTRDALTTATQVFAAGSTCFVRQSGGATLSGGEVNLTFQVEQ
jgi:hypothetical protein